MGLKGWLHILAALLGLGLAALIVFLVFGQASEQGELSGEAPGQGASARRCGSVNAAEGRSETTIKRAAADLPTILNEAQLEVDPRDDQKQWFARLHASAGLCIDEILVQPRVLTITATYPAATSKRQLDSFLIDAIGRAFEPPLARTQVSLTYKAGTAKGAVLVRADAWSAFQTGRTAMSLDRSLRGLQVFGKRTGYDASSLRVDAPGVA